MALLIGVGTSSDTIPEIAVSQALTEASDSLSGNKPTLIILFASPTTYDQHKLLFLCKQSYPESELIGASSAGEITSNGPLEKSIAIVVIYSDQIKFITGLGTHIKEGARNAGQEFAKSILAKSGDTKPQAVIIFPDGFSGDGAEIVHGVTDIYGQDFPIVGGSAGDDLLFKQTFQYYNGQLLSNCITGVGLFGNFSFGIGVRHGWIPIGTPRIATKSKSNVLYELDGKPALEMYDDHFGKNVLTSSPNIPFAHLAITYPLGITVSENEEYLIRDPLSVDSNGAITCTAEIPEGSEVNLMIGSREDAITAAQTAAKTALSQVRGKPIKLVFLFNSVARKKLLMNRKKEEIEKIKDIFEPGTPIIGFYTYGEQAPAGKTNPTSSFHNETVVLFILTE